MDKWNLWVIIQILIVLIVGVAVFSWLGIVIKYLKNQPESLLRNISSISLIQGNTLIGSNPVSIQSYSDIGLPIFEGNTLISQTLPFHPKAQIYATLINCLAQKESSNNPLAIGKDGERGLLQYMQPIFYSFCVERYKFDNDIWDVEIQRECCARMIEDGYIRLWTTSKFCK